MNDKV